MSALLGVVSVAGLIVAAIAWGLSSWRHRLHLQQCDQDLQRHQRLYKRLHGCVVEIERILDVLPSQDPRDLAVPEALVGHSRYLYGLRQEASDQAIELSRHAVRLQWSDAYLSKVTFTGKRCELAHGALIVAYQTLADAVREYERGIAIAVLTSGDGAAARAMSMPVRLLDEEAATEVAGLREQCRRALTNAADACGLRFETNAIFDQKWPVRRSEVPDPGQDPYDGEVRPIAWTGFGPQPILHVDAK